MKKIVVTGILVSDQTQVVLDGSGVMEDKKLQWTSTQDQIRFCWYGNENRLEKEDATSKMSILFLLNATSMIKYELKDPNYQMMLPIVTKKLEKEENQVEVCYQVQEEVNQTSEIKLKICWQKLV